MTTTTRTVLATSVVAPVLRASDLSRAYGFYRDTLGFETDPIDAPSRSFMVHAGGGSAILVYERPGGAPENTVLGFRVDDIGVAVSDLRAHGVRLEEYDMPGLKTVGGIATMGETKSAWFKDSEGNILSVNQM